MNILKSSRVLNQNCLREKIGNLSPLLKTLDWPPNKDSVFRASWNYYASGCQGRLSSIHRRIEQNARIVAPKECPTYVLPKALKLPICPCQLPPGLSLDDHIYQELVSCFRSAKSTDSVKKTNPKVRSKVQKYFDMGKFSTPEQWVSWKREERQVDQLLKKSLDPYLREEMSQKLQHLQKLTKRRPLVVLPNQEEVIEKKKNLLTKKKKSKRKLLTKSKRQINDSSSTTEDFPSRKKITILDNKKSNARETSSNLAVSYKPSHANFTTDQFLMDHPSLQSITSSRRSVRSISFKTKRKEKSKEIIEDNVSINDIDDQELQEQIGEETMTVVSEKNDKVQKLKNQKSTTKLKDKPSFTGLSVKSGSSWKPILRKSSSFGSLSYHSRGRTVSIKKSNEYIDRVKKKPLSLSDNCLLKILRDSSLRSNISLYRGDSINLDTKIHEIRKSLILSGDHHGWAIRVMENFAYVKPTTGKKKVLKKKQNYDSGNETLESYNFLQSAWQTNGENSPVFSKKKELENVYTSKTISEEEMSLTMEPRPLVIAEVIQEFMKKYGSKIRFLKAYPELFNAKELEKVHVKSDSQPKEDKKTKEAKKPKVQKVKEVKKKISKPFRKACSLCHCVRRKQSELRPYMQRMQKQRQRLEQKSYYIQRFMKCGRDLKNGKCTKKGLAICYKTLNLCQQIVEEEILKRSEGCQLE